LVGLTIQLGPLEGTGLTNGYASAPPLKNEMIKLHANRLPVRETGEKSRTRRRIP